MTTFTGNRFQFPITKIFMYIILFDSLLHQQLHVLFAVHMNILMEPCSICKLVLALMVSLYLLLVEIIMKIINGALTCYNYNF